MRAFCVSPGVADRRLATEQFAVEKKQRADMTSHAFQNEPNHAFQNELKRTNSVCSEMSWKTGAFMVGVARLVLGGCSGDQLGLL